MFVDVSMEWSRVMNGAEHVERHRVLVVEDDDAVRTLLVKQIADMGHEMHAAANAEEAMDQLRLDNFAVVVSDICMPGLDGIELTRYIKENMPATEVILITGYASVDSAVKAVRFGAVDYLTKPLGDIGRLDESVARALRRYRRSSVARALGVDLEAADQISTPLLDSLCFGLVVLDADSRLTLLNRRARSLLDQADGLSIGRDRRLRASTTTGRLALTGLQGEGRGPIQITRPSGLPPLHLFATPLNHADTKAGDGAYLALFISDPAERLKPDEDLLLRLYGLTEAEAHVAAALAQGRSAEEIAEEYGITINTARTHIKRIFSKTSTRRQGQLVSLLLSGLAQLRLGSTSDG
jgi:FixJ family two-component response regulator